MDRELLGMTPPMITMQLRRVVRGFLLLGLVVTLAACGSNMRVPGLGASARESALQASVDTYRKLMRWGNYEEAGQYVRAKDGKTTLPDYRMLHNYKIVGYHVGEMIMSEKGEEARVVSYVDYYDVDSGSTSTLRDDQYWWYDAERKHWYLGSPLPKFGPAGR